MPTENSSFEYSSEPKPLKSSKTKYRSEKMDITLSLMSDPRVVRGNTFSLARKVAQASENARVLIERTLNKAGNAPVSDQLPFPTYYYSEARYIGNDLDISKYLTEDETKNLVSTADESAQCDTFIPRPPTPEYIPRKTGVDMSTQVEDSKELFVFDVEVLPMLNVIVNKTIEQAMFECKAEAELLALSQAEEEFHAKKLQEAEWEAQKQAELIKEIQVQRARHAAQEKRAAEEYALSRVIAGRFCMEQIVPTIVEDLFQEMKSSGEWVDVNITAVKEEIMPKIVTEALKQVDRSIVAQSLAEDVLLSAQVQYDTIVNSHDRSTSVLLMIRINKTEAELFAIDEMIRVEEEAKAAAENENADGAETVVRADGTPRADNSTPRNDKGLSPRPVPVSTVSILMEGSEAVGDESADAGQLVHAPGCRCCLRKPVEIGPFEIQSNHSVNDVILNIQASGVDKAEFVLPEHLRDLLISIINREIPFDEPLYMKLPEVLTLEITPPSIAVAEVEENNEEAPAGEIEIQE